MKIKQELINIYSRLYRHFGPQHWWPGDTPFEIAVGAILTQNTNWANVEKAINNLKSAKILTPRKLYATEEKKLASLVRPSGYFNVKARRLRSFLDMLFKSFNGSLSRLFRLPASRLREKLLEVNGIGKETADSIILYAADKPVFVIDNYTKRILSRHGICRPENKYDEIKSLFEDNLEPDTEIFNEYHALLVKLGKDYCRPRKPLCEICPLKGDQAV